jgi:hypothetical protein
LRERLRQLKETAREKTSALIPLGLDRSSTRWDNVQSSEIRRLKTVNFAGWEHNRSKCDAQIDRVGRTLPAGNGGREAPPAPLL